MTSTQEQAQEAAAAAKDKAASAAEQARGRARDQIDTRSTQAGEQVATQASDVRSVATALRDQGQDKPAELAEKAADRAEQLGDYLKRTDADTLLTDLEDFGRRQPMAVVFGGLALGFAASRFLKASSQQRATAATRSPIGAPSSAATPAPVLTTPPLPAPVAPVPPATAFGDPAGERPLPPVAPSAHPVGGL